MHQRLRAGSGLPSFISTCWASLSPLALHVDNLEAISARPGRLQRNQGLIGSHPFLDRPQPGKPAIEEALEEGLHPHRSRDEMETDGEMPHRRKQAIAAGFRLDPETSIKRGAEVVTVQQLGQLRNVRIMNAERAR